MNYYCLECNRNFLRDTLEKCPQCGGTLIDDSNRESLLEITLLKLIGEGSMRNPGPEVVLLLKQTGILKNVDYGLVPPETLQAIYDYQSQPMQDNLYSRRARADLLWLVPYCGELCKVVQVALDVVNGLKPPEDLTAVVKRFMARERGEGEPHAG